jgi:hypothetical protein
VLAGSDASDARAFSLTFEASPCPFISAVSRWAYPAVQRQRAKSLSSLRGEQEPRFLLPKADSLDKKFKPRPVTPIFDKAFRCRHLRQPARVGRADQKRLQKRDLPFLRECWETRTMTWAQNHIPKYRLHTRSGRAVVSVRDRDVYLVEHGVLENKAEYRRQTAEFLAAGREDPHANRRGEEAAMVVGLCWKLAAKVRRCEQSCRLPGTQHRVSGGVASRGLLAPHSGHCRSPGSG